MHAMAHAARGALYSAAARAAAHAAEMFFAICAMMRTRERVRATARRQRGAFSRCALRARYHYMARARAYDGVIIALCGALAGVPDDAAAVSYAATPADVAADVCCRRRFDYRVNVVSGAALIMIRPPISRQRFSPLSVIAAMLSPPPADAADAAMFTR